MGISCATIFVQHNVMMQTHFRVCVRVAQILVQELDTVLGNIFEGLRFS